MSWRRSLLTVLVTLWALPALADVTFVAEQSNKGLPAASLDLTSVSCGSGNLCLFSLAWRNAMGETANTPTYGGSTTGITAIVPTIGGGGAMDGCSGGVCLKVWYACDLVGTQTIQFTVSGSTSMMGGVKIYSGVDCAGTPLGTSVQNDSTDLGIQSTVSTNLTTLTGGMGSDALVVADEEPGNMADAGQSLRAFQTDAGNMSFWTSDEFESAAMGWAWGPPSLQNFVHIVTPLNPGMSTGGGGGGSGTVSYVSSYSAKDVSGTATSLDVTSVDCGTGNFCLFSFTWRNATAQTANTPTYNGSTTGITAITPMTGAMGATDGCAGGACLRVWYACGLTGTQTVQFTVTGAATSLMGAVHVYGDVDCAGMPIGTAMQNDSLDVGIASLISTNVTTNTGGMASDALYLLDEEPGTVPDAGQTQRQTQSDSGNMSLWTSDEPSSTAMGWAWGPPDLVNFVHIVTPLNAGATSGGGGGGCRGSLMLLRAGGC